jgi:hypothetical protein
VLTWVPRPGVTRGVLPVLVHGEWQVETVMLDLGSGMREWIEVRGYGSVQHCDGCCALQQLLQHHRLSLADFAEVDTTDDGCE